MHILENLLDEVLGDELDEDFTKAGGLSTEATEEEALASLEKLEKLVGDSYDEVHRLLNTLDPTKAHTGRC